MKILLSAGHGGTDSGSIGADGGKEKDRTINLANKVAAYLRKAGHSVTVNTEKTSSGAWRFKNRKGYDFALSIHFNAFNGSATGTEVLYKGTKKKASELSSAVAKTLGIKDRGPKSRPGLYMMNIGFDNLIEVCFHDHKADLDKYNAKIDEVAKTIADVLNGSAISGGTVDVDTSDSLPNYTGEIIYQSYDNKKKKWLPEVSSRNYSTGKGNSYAGNYKNGMGGLRAKPKYGEITIQAHVLGGDWLSPISSANYSKNNSTNGNSYSGLMGRKIDAFRITSTRGYVTYQVHVTEKRDSKGNLIRGAKWLPEVDSRDANDGTINSYAGNFGEEIDGIRMK